VAQRAAVARPASTTFSEAEQSRHLQGVADFFDEFAAEEQRWRRKNAWYHRLIASICRFHIARDASVLEIGSGSGDLLAALEPRRGLGIDVSPRMVELARSRHPALDFQVAAGEDFERDETFDYVVLSDLVPFGYDLLSVLKHARAMSHEGTRLVLHSYSQLWRPVIRLAESLRLKRRKPIHNWVTPEDVRNLLDLAGFEVISITRRILVPKRVPVLSTLLNGIVANVWPFSHLCLTYWVVARPAPQGPRADCDVSIVVPCRNEEGNVAAVFERLPELGNSTELVFVEGNSRDGTRAEIERQIALHPERKASLHLQTGVGKGDAMRLGFEQAGGELVMILDGDLSVAPEDLGAFYDAFVSGRADFINGSRLVYELEPRAMRFLNVFGNKFFSLAFSTLIGQHVKDSLCGTKVLLRSDYERIAEGRSYFGDFDPFGDFDLLLGGAKLGLKIVDLPVRYRARTYGTTNISRFRHGLLLLRMVGVAFVRFRVTPVRP
jgi:SAM-dependent methyltransferase